MNKQEVLYLPVIKEGLIYSTDDDCKIYYRTLDGEEVSSLFKAKSKVELLGQLKPVVPKFVAEWLEECKSYCRDLQKALYRLDDDDKVGDWARDENDDLIAEKVDMIARAWLDGYEIAKEVKDT